jgi:hypothetical protein
MGDGTEFSKKKESKRCSELKGVPFLEESYHSEAQNIHFSN